LIVRVQSGDRTALALIYDRHAGYLLGLGAKMTRSREVAEDVLHDVFVEAWEKAGQFRPDRATVRTWLAMRMRSRCLDRMKSHAVSKSEGWAEGFEPPSYFSAGRLPRMVDANRATDALNGLSKEQREVLELGYFKGLSSGEISGQLGIPTGTVKSRTRSALAALRAGFGGSQ
jgi:RNA polymerase sigma-70 factor (ECF subfamily)